MNTTAMTPQQVIDACRTRLAAARSIETVRFEELYAVGMLGTLRDLQLISRDAWHDLVAEFDALGDAQRVQIEQADASRCQRLALGLGLSVQSVYRRVMSLCEDEGLSKAEAISRMEAMHHG
jgi:hypothetical protein